MILSKMSEVLQKISDFVNVCLGPLGSDGFNWSQLRDIIIQIIATLILFVVIRVFLWKRVTNILEARRAATDKELEEAKANNALSRQLAAETQAKLDEAQEKIRAMIDKAERDANLRRDEIVYAAKEDAKRRLENVEIEINQEIQKKTNEIHKQIVDIAMMAAEKIVEHEIDQDKYLDIINEIIEGAAK